MELQPPETETTNRTVEQPDTNDVLEEEMEAATRLPLDVIFDLLANERRRRVVRYLLSESESTTLGELAEHIAAIENDKPESALSSTERKRVYISLYQSHLPKMDDAGAIEFDENRKTVEIGPNLTELTDYLPVKEGVPTESPSWSRYYLGTAILGVGAFFVGRLFVPADWLSGIIVGVLLATVALTAVANLRRSDQLPWK